MSTGPTYSIQWGKPIHVTMLPDGGVSVDLSKIPDGPGIYIFLRKHGNHCDALYVGKGLKLRQRIENQLNNLKLMKEIRNSPNGSKLLVVGHYTPKQGQQLSPSLLRIEKAFIRHFVAHNDTLLNIQGTKLKLATVESERGALKSFLPLSISVELT